MEDSFDSLEDDDLEEAAQEEVDKILWEVTSGRASQTHAKSNHFSSCCISHLKKIVKTVF